MFANHQHARKKFLRFLFSRQGHDDWPHPLQFPAWKWWPTVCIFSVKTIVRLSKSVAVSEKLPCQREGANSEDLFAVAASWSYIGREKFPLFARCFYDKTGQPSVDILDLRLEGTVFDSLSARNLWRKKFSLQQIFASWWLIAKIAKISASQNLPAIRYIYQKRIRMGD